MKWIIGWLIELLDGKHPSWVVRLSVLRLLPHLSADAWGWHAHVHCQRWESKAVVCSLCVLWQTSCQRHVLIKNTSAEMGGTQKQDDATLLDEMQPEALLHKTTGCARVTSTSYQLYRYKYHGIGSNNWLLKWYIFIESHLLALGAILRPLAVTARNATEPPKKCEVMNTVCIFKSVHAGYS